jgi:hypothetical protein
MTEEWLTVGEDICSLILWVDILMETRTVVHIGVLKLELDSIALLQKFFVEYPDPMIQELKITLLNLGSIDLDI